MTEGGDRKETEGSDRKEIEVVKRLGWVDRSCLCVIGNGMGSVNGLKDSE